MKFASTCAVDVVEDVPDLISNNPPPPPVPVNSTSSQRDHKPQQTNDFANVKLRKVLPQQQNIVSFQQMYVLCHNKTHCVGTKEPE
jgi:hypothetical protein